MRKHSIVRALLGCATLVLAAGLATAAPEPVSPRVVAPAGTTATATATFAGGCFWCMEPAFEKLDGVLSATVGYTGGNLRSPTYEQVSAGRTGHRESVQVVFDPKRISYEKLLDVYWHNVDPIDPDGQFCDHGDQYRTAIFVHDEAQRRAAETSLQAIDRSGKLPGPIVTQILPASTFWPAEDYHQGYSQKNPERYCAYRDGCRRDVRLRQLWGAAAAAH